MHDPLDYMEIRRGLPNNGFGMVRNGGKRPHQGWDLWAPVGTPVFAVGNGIVEFVRVNSGDYGTQVCISFENPDSPGTLLYAFYAHLSQVFVKTKDWVTEGQRLGLSGNTVRNHVASIYGKTGVNRRAALVAWARERGLI